MTGETEKRMSFRRLGEGILIAGKQTGLAEYFFRVAAIILFVTALAKLIGAKGDDPIFNAVDPFLLLKNRSIMILFGMVELLASALLILNRNETFKAMLTAWLSTVFLVYHAGLRWMGTSSICNCLGNLKDVLALSPRTEGKISFIIIGFMMVGSFFLLVRDFLGIRKGKNAINQQVASIGVKT